mmetsp:Transcript_6146/g.24430  ORF Transcript_6146/g.24430 Transcript_6146/m.24430 type:complete len:200 (+) Transcript_6146:1190-1789(+)
MESYKPAADIPSRSSTLALLRTMTRAFGPNFSATDCSALADGLSERTRFWMASHVSRILTGSSAYWLSSRSKLSRCSSLLMLAHANSIAPNGMTTPAGAANAADPEEFSAIVLNRAHIADFVPAMRIDFSSPRLSSATRSNTVPALERSVSRRITGFVACGQASLEAAATDAGAVVGSSLIPVVSALSFTAGSFAKERA